MFHSCVLPGSPDQWASLRTWGPALSAPFHFPLALPQPSCAIFSEISTESKVNCGQLGGRGMQTYSPTWKKVCLPVGREDILIGHGLPYPTSGGTSSLSFHSARWRRMGLGVRHHLSNPILLLRLCPNSHLWLICIPHNHPRALPTEDQSTFVLRACITGCLGYQHPCLKLQRQQEQSKECCPENLPSWALILIVWT